ncbi:N-acetylmuramoyl-L-alanine amidase [Flavobacterium sp. SE-s28]|uniref:N-acetylmuramoyl-L-alanine amidase n=2 Tax=Flavobacterium silvaticum TaxID=1852020 RepID=A0A972JKD9_9FLAO|nr:N-acetylmuramoyl-L-alanine amidase [Flavobacterium silvaticum]
MMFYFNASVGQSNIFKVTLDAGHGGKDTGANYNGHVEKEISLAVVREVGRILENTSGIKVIYTRKTDVFIELVERANIANRANSNIFVSIHCNANKNSAAEGTETYVMGMTKNKSNLEAAKRENSVVTLEKDYKQKYEGFDPNSPETMIGIDIMAEEYMKNSIALADNIQDIFVNKLDKKSRGVKQAPYMVLHKAYMPRVLIEMGFISNPNDGSYLDSESGQKEIAQAIANAIISYKKEYFGGSQDEPEIKPSQRIPDSDTKTIAVKPEPKDTVSESKSAPVVNGVVFKVQISSSSRKLPLQPKNFKGLKGVSMTTEGKNYRYYYGKTSDIDTIRRQCEEVKSKYPSAFVVAFRNGKNISMDEAVPQ